MIFNEGKMLKRVLLVVCFLLPVSNAYGSQNQWKVIQMAGSGAQCGEQVLAVGQLFNADKCIIKTPAQTKLIVSNNKDVTVTIGADTQVRLQSDSTSQFSAKVVQGLTRWLFKTDTSKKRKYSVTTANAIMGIRGTELMASFNPLLSESEVICFEGTFDLTHAVTKKSKTIGKNQWGGIGGRFGSFAEVLTLSDSLMNHFNVLTRFN